MIRQIHVWGGVFTLLAMVFIGNVQANDQPKDQKQKIVHVSASEAEFVEVVPGVSKTVLWGDHDGGPYGAFTRFAPGTDNGTHTHTNDIRIVVLEGAYLYSDEQGEKRVGPGEFILVPGRTKHWSGGDKEEGTLFYEESPAGFDLLPE